METLPFLIVVFGGIVVLKMVLNRIEKNKACHAAEKYSYRIQSSVLTKTELAFYRELRTAVPSGVTLLVKPRIADFVEVRPFNRAGFNRINSKHVDFLLCCKDSMSPVLAIELDDSSHGSHKTRLRDAFVESLYDSIGLPICRFPVARTYDPKKISSAITLSFKGLPPPMPKNS